MATVDDIHRFWFGDLNDAGMASAEVRGNWFAGGPEFDQQIRQQFGDTVVAAAQGQLDGWHSGPERSAKSWLCYLIVCDQFSRNLFRGSPRAFDLDPGARDVARQGLNAQLHLQLGIDEQAFAYLPFEHSEALLDQYLAVGLYTSLRDHAAKPQREAAGAYLRHAQQHRDTILRFGRFPYRNEALGRTSTAAERSYLETNQTPG